MDEKLKLCPFCGGEARLRVRQVAEDAVSAHVECSRCLAATDHFEDAYAPSVEAIDAWNSRHGENTARAAGYAAGIADAAADLAWFSNQHSLELVHYLPTYCDDDDQSVEWRVHQQVGGINDREWRLVGRGQTAAEAIAAARRALSTSEKGEAR